jgi:CheY-like chemotaxis protein
MKVLVVDDDLNKIRQLTAFIKSEFPRACVDERKSYQSGLKAALLDNPDVIVLDMTMPTFDVGGKEKGGRERRYAGVQILRQLRRKEIRTAVVIVTQFERFGEGDDLITLDELREQLVQEFEHNYICTICYQAADSQWKDKLREVLGRLSQDRKEDDNERHCSAG